MCGAFVISGLLGACSSTTTPCTTPSTCPPGADLAGLDFAKGPDFASTLQCAAQTADCDGNTANGCETNTATDAANCGACGYSCGGGTCSNGGCLLAKPGPGFMYTFNDFSCLAVDATNVYFTAVGLSASGPSGILYVPQSGGAVTALAGGATNAVGPTTYGGFVYWADRPAGKIYETPAPGQAGTTRTVVSGLNQPVNLAVDANNIYWTSTGGAGAADKATGTTKWTTNQPSGSPWGITIDATDVYYTDPMANAVVKVSIATGTPTVIASSQTKARGITSDATNLAWSMPPSGVIILTQKASPMSTPLISGVTSPWSLALDSSTSPSVLYWGQQTMMGTVSKSTIGTSPATTTIAPSQTFATCVALAGNSVYWLTNGGTQLLKAPK
jgi:hypothetical protein